MFKIVNWVLTRKCNLRCEYCGFVHDSKCSEYPKIKELIENEKDYEYVISCLSIIKNISPDCFHIFYGGEPLLYDGLDKVISFCNKNDINYTIITNGTFRDKLETLLDECGTIKGLTCSCDPVDLTKSGDRERKTKKSFEIFEWAKTKGIGDLVAEITMDGTNYMFTPMIVERLNEMGVWASVTCYDPPKNKYYDFSMSDRDENNKWQLQKNKDVENIFNKIKTYPNVHLPELLGILFESLPAEYDCKLPSSKMENVTVDSDGKLRLCLRVRGINVQKNDFLDTLELIENNKVDMGGGVLLDYKIDYEKYCKQCNWTCPMMSSLVSTDPGLLKKLLHK